MIHVLQTSKRISAKNIIKAVIVIMMSALILSIIILSLVPPVSKDALTHHLAVPKLYLKYGGIHEIPDIIFSYYPMNLEMLYMIPLYFNNDIVPKFIHFSFALLTAWLVFYYLKKRIDTVYALFGAFFFLSIPVIIKLSITVYVDLGLIFFSTASLFFLFEWIENQFTLKYLLISAFMCGLSLGTKYNGLITLLLLTFFVPVLYSRKFTSYFQFGPPSTYNGNEFKKQYGSASTQFKSVGNGIVFLLVSLVIFSPWMIRNYIWTNNPVYPLYNTYFNPAVVDPSSELVMDSTMELRQSENRLVHFSLRSLIYNESWWQIALIPFRIFFEGQDGTPQYFDGKLNPLLFFLPFFAFLRSNRHSSILRVEKNILLAFAILFILFVFLLRDMRIRWMAPAIPPLVILSIFGLNEIFTTITDKLSENAGRICKGLIFLIVLLLVCINAGYLLKQFRYVEPISYISGGVNRDDYIENYRREYPAIQYANRNLSENAKILCLFLGDRRYYSDREMFFDEDFFYRAVKQANSSKDMLIRFNEKGITHLLVRYDLFNRWSDTNFDNRDKEMMENLFKQHVNLLFFKEGYGLFELKPS